MMMSASRICIALDFPTRAEVLGAATPPETAPSPSFALRITIGSLSLP